MLTIDVFQSGDYSTRVAPSTTNDSSFIGNKLVFVGHSEGLIFLVNDNSPYGGFYQKPSPIVLRKDQYENGWIFWPQVLEDEANRIIDLLTPPMPEPPAAAPTSEPETVSVAEGE